MGDYILTLRCHPNDTQLFEDYFILIKNWLQTEIKKYSYSIEMDGTLNRHLHLYIHHDFRDADKVKRRITTKEFKSIQIILKQSKTILATALKVDKVTKTPKKALGYTQKWNCERREYKGYTDQEILDAVEFYYTSERIEKSEVINNDWTHVTNKNFHATVEDYAKKNKLPLKDSDLIKIRMVKDKHTFQLPSKDQERYFKEIRIANCVHSQADEYSCSQEAYAIDKNYDGYMEEEIRDLLKYIKTLKDNNIELNIPPRVFAINQKYDY